MSFVFSRFSKNIASFCSLVILLAAIPIQAVAQSDIQDFEAPVIEHDTSEYSEGGAFQQFSATVADNVAVSVVKLFYRFEGQDEFKELEMTPVATSSLYSVSIFIEDQSDTLIEYYIQAEDDAGNVVLKGYAFEPLVREISQSDAEDSIASTQPEEPVLEKPKSKVLYYVLGALAVGAIAAGLSGSDGGTGGTTESCGDAGCEITFTLTSP